MSHQFSSALSGTLTDGENLLSDIGNSAGADLGSLNEKIQSVNGKVDSAMYSINSVIQLNEKIIDLLSQLDSAIPGSPASDLIAQLQAENQRHQELLNSLQQEMRESAMRLRRQRIQHSRLAVW